MSQQTIPPASFVGSTPYASPLAGAIASSDSRTRNRLPVLYWSAVLLALVALSISGYLTYVAFTSSKILGCGGGTFNCEHVLNSKWSTLLGAPVAAWASALYLSVLATLAATARPAMSTVPSSIRTWSWGIVTAAAVSAGLAALWFTGLQIFILKHLCPWCLGAHSCGLLLCIATLAMSPLSGRLKAMCAGVGFLGAATLVGIQMATPAPPTYIIEEFPTPSVETTDGAAGAAMFEEPEMFDAPAEGDDVLSAPGTENDARLDPALFNGQDLKWVQAGIQLFFQPELLLTAQVGGAGQATGNSGSGTGNDAANNIAAQGNASQGNAPQDNANQEERLVQVASANLKLRAHQWPIIGSPNAKHIFVELFDYTCPHCRVTQQAIRGVRQKYKDDLAIIVLAVPLSRACNDTVTSEHASHRESCELARYAVALWRVAPDKFEGYHEWLLSTEPVPTAAAARAKAIELVGAEAFDKELAQPHAARYISKHVEVYRKMGAGPVPKLVFANTALTGELRSPQVLIDTIERQANR